VPKIKAKTYEDEFSFVLDSDDTEYQIEKERKRLEEEERLRKEEEERLRLEEEERLRKEEEERLRL